MAVKIIGLIIGALVLGAGVYYRAKEKDDPESRKIYTLSLIHISFSASLCLAGFS